MSSRDQFLLLFIFTDKHDERDCDDDEVDDISFVYLLFVGLFAT